MRKIANNVKKSKAEEKKTFSRLIGRLKPYRLEVAISLLLSAFSVALTLYVPVLVGEGIDLIVGPHSVDFEGVFDTLVKIGLAVALTSAFQWISSLINQRIAFHMVRDVRNEAFARLEVLPLRNIDTNGGDFVSRIVTDAEQFSEGLLLAFSQLFTGALTIVGTLIFMLAIRPSMALVVVLLTPLSFLVARLVAKNTYALFRRQSEIRAEETALIDELLAGQKVVKAFSREKESLKRFDEVNGRLEVCSRRALFFSSLTNPGTRFVNSIVYAAVALTGALASIQTAGTATAFTVGALASFLAYANQYTKPFNEISGVITELQNAFACASRVFSLIDMSAEKEDAPDAAVLEDVDGNVRLSHVAFSYTEDRPLLRDLTFEARAGQKIAIVGPTGCGKTTLINLLMRFYDVQAGSITVDGLDVRTITRHSLRTQYGMVLQDTWLSAGTVRENIAMGKPSATDEEIVAAAKASHAHGFITRLPSGYDTVLGEGGGSLSQGQKQLLCIARVMLSLPPILILDEATSSIDTRTEKKIQEAFSRMMKGRTTFIVAHRLSTIRTADLILVMDDGDIVEQGTHRELLLKDGFYAKLYRSQFDTMD